MMEMARKMGMNRSTLYRILAALTESGFVKKDPSTQKYSLGLKIIELAGNILGKMEVREIARPVLQELVQTTKETVHLGVLNKDGGSGGEIIYIDKVDGPEPVGLRTSVGKTLPVYVTALGKAITAFLPEDELEEVVDQQSFERQTHNTITSRQEFLECLQTVRARGYATDNEENRLTASCIAAPIFDIRGRVIAAISISGPLFRLSPKRMETLVVPLKSAAAEISKGLGCQADVAALKQAGS